MKILFLGDIVGRPARQVLQEHLPRIIRQEQIDFAIANAENSAAGSGITMKVADDLFASGLDILTLGDHAFKKKEAIEVLRSRDVLRPLNLGDLAEGRGWLVKRKQGKTVGVINLIGRVFMGPSDCPFKSADCVLQKITEHTKTIIVDMHAEATSEKIALGYYLSTRVSAVVGTHTHIPTADQRLIKEYTAYITDLGMCGAFDSVLGRAKDDIIKRFLTNMPGRFELAQVDLRLQGVIIDVDDDAGRARSIRRVEYCY